MSGPGAKTLASRNALPDTGDDTPVLGIIWTTSLGIVFAISGLYLILRKDS